MAFRGRLPFTEVVASETAGVDIQRNEMDESKGNRGEGLL